MNRRLLGIQIRRALSHLKIKHPITYTFAPTSADVAGTLGEKSIVYHCVDEFAAFSDAGSEVAARERELLKKSDVVLCSAAALFERKKAHNANTHLVTHGVDYDFFRKTVDPATPVGQKSRTGRA